MTVKATAHAIEQDLGFGVKYVVHLHFRLLPAGSGERTARARRPEREEQSRYQLEEADLRSRVLRAGCGGRGKAGDQILKKFFAELVEEMKEARRLIGLLDNPENMVTAAFVINQIRTWMRERSEAAETTPPAWAMLVAAARHDPAPGTTTRRPRISVGPDLAGRTPYSGTRRRVSSVGLLSISS